jgi:hypothetical protein
MEARVIAAAIALSLLIGLGAGWQLMPRRQVAATVTVTETRLATVTLAGATVERTATSTILVPVGAAATTVTVTAPPPALPRILLPTARLDCGGNGTFLWISFVVANAGTGTILVNVSGIAHGLRGVEELERLSSPYAPPGVAEAGPQEAHIALAFTVTDPGELERLLRPQPEGFSALLLSVGIRVPYSWEGGSGVLELGEVPLTLSERCGLPNK